MWRELVIETLVRPRAAARRVLALEPPPAVLLEAAVAVVCIGLVLGFVAMQLAGGAVDPISAAVLGEPLIGAAAQLGMMALVAILTFRVGRMFGGSGGFWASATVIIWLNAVTLVIQVVQLAALAIAPPIAGLISIATLFWLLWAFANFTTELHDFESPIMVLGVTVLTVIVLIFVLTLLAALFGIGPQGAG